MLYSLTLYSIESIGSASGMDMSNPETPSKWTSRFLYAAIAQGFCAFVITALIVLPIVNPTPSKIIAAGSAGTWLTVGYLAYITVGVVGVGVTALFYHLLESSLHKKMSPLANGLAWIHLILMNVGAAAATWMLMYAGFLGGAGLMATSSGGGGLNAGQVHLIINPYVDPIGYAIIALGLGVFLGGIGFIMTLRSKSQ